MWHDWQVGWEWRPGRECRQDAHFCSCPSRPPAAAGSRGVGDGEVDQLDNNRAASCVAAGSALDAHGGVQSPLPLWKTLL